MNDLPFDLALFWVDLTNNFVLQAQGNQPSIPSGLDSFQELSYLNHVFVLFNADAYTCIVFIIGETISATDSGIIRE